jgi:hypothetical protein
VATKTAFGRRRLLAGGAGLLSALSGRRALAGDDDDAARHDARLPRTAPTLVYVSAPDCPSCVVWNRVFRASFEASDVRDRLRFVTVHLPSVRSGWASAVWPADVVWVREALEARQVRRAIPLFALVQKGAVVAVVEGCDTKYDYGWYGGFYGRVLKSVGMA